MNKIYKLTIRSILLSALFVLMSTSAHAATCTSNTGGGDWNLSGTWDCPAVPAAEDDVVINHSVFFTADIAQVNDITITGTGTLTQQNTNQQIITGDLTIESGGTWTHGDNGETLDYKIYFQMENLDLKAGGSIDVSGKGYDPGVGINVPGKDGYGPSPGIAAGNYSNGGSGAGNGGRGGDAWSAWSLGGDAICDLNNISNLGSGGGGGSFVYGGAGGGLVILNVNNIAQLNGNINLSGDDGIGTGGGDTGGGGGGAGGSMSLNANTISGTAQTFLLNGGNGGNSNYTARSGGGGGGGCVKLKFVNSSSIAINNISISGGPTTAVTSPIFTFSGVFTANGDLCTQEDIDNGLCGFAIYDGFDGLVEVSQNVVLPAPEFSDSVYLLTLLTAFSLIYYFGKSKIYL